MSNITSTLFLFDMNLRNIEGILEEPLGIHVEHVERVNYVESMTPLIFTPFRAILYFSRCVHLFCVCVIFVWFYVILHDFARAEKMKLVFES